jgi:hypothetical protein
MAKAVAGFASTVLIAVDRASFDGGDDGLTEAFGVGDELAPPDSQAATTRRPMRIEIHAQRKASLRSYVGGGYSAVDDELGACHERRFVGGEVEGGFRDLTGLAEAADGDVD